MRHGLARATSFTELFHAMLDLCERLGFSIADDPADPGVKIVTLIVRPGV